MKTKVITQAVIKFKSKYLLGKRALAKKNAPNQFEFISGFIDTSESAEEIILREIKEETNLDCKIIKSSEPYLIEDKEARWIIIPFLLESKNDKFKLNDEDHSELKWVSIEELKNYEDIKEDIKNLKIRDLI